MRRAGLSASAELLALILPHFLLNVQFVLQDEWACDETHEASGSLLGTLQSARYYSLCLSLH